MSCAQQSRHTQIQWGSDLKSPNSVESKVLDTWTWKGELHLARNEQQVSGLAQGMSKKGHFKKGRHKEWQGVGNLSYKYRSWKLPCFVVIYGVFAHSVSLIVWEFLLSQADCYANLPATLLKENKSIWALTTKHKYDCSFCAILKLQKAGSRHCLWEHPDPSSLNTKSDSRQKARWEPSQPTSASKQHPLPTTHWGSSGSFLSPGLLPWTLGWLPELPLTLVAHSLYPGVEGREGLTCLSSPHCFQASAIWAEPGAERSRSSSSSSRSGGSGSQVFTIMCKS